MLVQMQDARFFESARGKIVAELRRRHSASALDLAVHFGLSANAVRQQLTFLERDGYVAERSVRRGATKPTREYSLTPSADELFPQTYDRMLNAVLRAVRSSFGDEGVRTVFEKLGEETAAKLSTRFHEGESPRKKAEELALLLRENGVEVDLIEKGGLIELREHNCPYAKTVREHPEVCSLIHRVMEDAMPGHTVQVESLATGGGACRFEIPE
jgi:predicted ArsR family transcriptional regulator